MYYIVHSETTHYSGTQLTPERNDFFVCFNNQNYISDISTKKITNKRVSLNLFFLL